jgi:hypothetical protein
MATKTNPGRAVGAIRKDLDAQELADLQRIAKIFKTIAEHNPQAVIDAFNKRGGYIATLDAAQKQAQVQYLLDNAEYLIDLLELR